MRRYAQQAGWLCIGIGAMGLVFHAVRAVRALGPWQSIALLVAGLLIAGSMRRS